MKIEVLTVQWATDDDVYPGGVHEIDDPSATLIAAAAAAEAVGSIKVSASSDERAKMRASVESDAESEKKLTAAQKDGSWHVGNLGDYIAVKSSLLKDHGDSLSDETRASLELGIDQSKQILARLEDGKSYEDAVTEVLNG